MRSTACSLALAAAVALGGCATSRPRPSVSCDAAFDHANDVLREGFASYAAEIRKFAAARDPGMSTAAAEERAWSRADAWTAERRPGFLAECRAWPEDRVRCVLVADVPRVLSACGLEPLVTSFTDDVVASFAAKRVEAPAASR